ncbi:hypothetical protein BSKO_04476 [Bryopsis sp. KO-2023]|nr:hypothetical protein BSKO_04476 [Bryopsis sp. KO-2023]
MLRGRCSQTAKSILLEARLLSLSTTSLASISSHHTAYSLTHGSAAVSPSRAETSQWVYWQQRASMGFFFQDPAKVHPADRNTIMEDFHKVVANPTVSWKMKDACSMKARLFINALDPKSMTMIFDSCRRGGYASWALFAIIAQHVVEKNMAPKFTQNECAVVLISLGTIAKLHANGLVGDPQSAIRQYLSNREKGAKNRDKTDHTPSIRVKRKKYRNAPITEQNMFPRCGTFVQLLCQTMYTNIQLHKSPVLPPSAVGELLYGLGWLYRKDGGMFLGQGGKRIFKKMLTFITESDKLLARCTTHDLCNMMHGCASVRYQNKKVFNRICGRLHGRLDRIWGEADPGPNVDDPGKEAKANHSASDSEGDGFEGDDGFELDRSKGSKEMVEFRMWWERKAEDSTEISDLDIANVTWACAKLGLYHSFVLRSLCPVIQDRLPELPDEILATSMRAYGDLYFENPTLAEAVGQAVSQPKRLKKMDEDYLVDVIFGLAQMGYRDEKVIDILTKDIIQRRKWSDFSERSLGSLVSAFGRIQLKDKKAIDSLGKEICERGAGSRFTEEDYHNIVYGFEKLGYMSAGGRGKIESKTEEQSADSPQEGNVMVGSETG